MCLDDLPSIYTLIADKGKEKQQVKIVFVPSVVSFNSLRQGRGGEEMEGGFSFFSLVPPSPLLLLLLLITRPSCFFPSGLFFLSLFLLGGPIGLRPSLLLYISASLVV